MAEPWTRERIMNDSGYIGKNLVLPEDREYLEGYMNRYYPNHNNDLTDITQRGIAANNKYMQDQGYHREGSGWANNEGAWTSGTWKPYNELFGEFNKTRQGTLRSEIDRKYPDWPEDYRGRVADDVYTKWNNRFLDGPASDNKEPTQNIANAVQGVM